MKCGAGKVVLFATPGSARPKGIVKGENVALPRFPP